MTATNFTVTNSTAGPLANQKILVFLTPLMNSSNYLYAVWQQLNPADGASSYFTLNQNIAAYLDTGNTTSAAVAIAPGTLSSAVVTGGLTSTLGAPQPSSLVISPDSGVQNATSPYQPFKTQWCVDQTCIATTVNTITASGLSRFHTDYTLYWAVSASPSSDSQQIQSVSTPYQVAFDSYQVSVSVTYSQTAGTFGFTFADAGSTARSVSTVNGWSRTPAPSAMARPNRGR